MLIYNYINYVKNKKLFSKNSKLFEMMNVNTIDHIVL